MAQGVEWMERHQIALYVVALACGAMAGLLFPPLTHPAETAIKSTSRRS